MAGEENPMRRDGRGWSHRTAPVGWGSHVTYLDGRDGPTPAYLPAHRTEWGRRDSLGAELCATAIRIRTCARRGNSFCCRIRSVCERCRDCDRVCECVCLLELVINISGDLSANDHDERPHPGLH
jgi:hypothetical protein